MSLATDGLVEVTVSGNWQGVPWNNIMYYWNTTNAPVQDMDEIPALVDAAWVNRFAILTANTCNYTQIKARDVFGLTGDAFATPTDPNGNLLEESLPALNAVRIDFAVGDKSTGRGYKRMAGLTEPQTTEGFLTSTALTAWNTEAQNFLNQIITTSMAYFPVIYGGPTPNNPTRSQANIIVSATARGRVTSQVSRKGSN